MIRVGVIGAAGKMGRMVCATVADDPDLALVAAIDRSHVGEYAGALAGVRIEGVRISDEMDTMLQAEVEVAVDFTHPKVVRDDIRWLIDHAMHGVVGTTGLTDEDYAEIAGEIELEGSETNVFIAPNFALGAVLAERFAIQAARWFPAAEIIELHHDGKADAPSGTALKAAKEILGARASEYHGPTDESVPGARGADMQGLRVHSVRLPGLVAHEEIIFGGRGQTLTIRHDSMDRSSFMPGVLMAVKSVSTLPGLTVGLDKLLRLEHPSNEG
ncbi:MAG: 4-hydroxy-tetrahydrodipicolinate reductase [Actinomycetota bacterium]